MKTVESLFEYAPIISTGLYDYKLFFFRQEEKNNNGLLVNDVWVYPLIQENIDSIEGDRQVQLK